MKFFHSIVVLLLLNLAFGQSETLYMSLEECVQYALENNHDIITSTLEKGIAQTQVDEALAKGLPQVNGNIGVTNNIKIQTSFISDFISPGVYEILRNENLLPANASNPAAQTFPAQFGVPWTSQAGVTASQLIFDGSFFVGLQASKTVRLLSEKQQRQTEVDVVENVSKTYYLVLIGQRNLEFLARSFATVDTLLYETTQMYENGFSEKIDVSRIKINHNNIKTNLKNSTEFLVTSYNLLKFQMGMPVEQTLILSDELTSLEESVNSLNVDTSGAIYRRPEYDVLQTNRALINLNIKNFRYQYVPNLYANFNVGWTAGTNTFSDLNNFNNRTWFRYSSIGFNLNIPIFDGLRKRANIQRNKVQLQQVETGISQLENNIKREVVESVVKHENALRNIEAQRENLDLSGEIYETTKIKYKEGVGSNIEVVQTITDYEEARNNYLSALFDAVTAQIELKKALGTLY